MMMFLDLNILYYLIFIIDYYLYNIHVSDSVSYRVSVNDDDYIDININLKIIHDYLDVY